MVCFFPTKTIKEPPPDFDVINYAYSPILPTLNQLRPFQLRPFRFVHIIPMAPLNSMLTFVSPTPSSQFTTCPRRCEVCTSYHLYFQTHLYHPIIPCLMMPCIYAVFKLPLTVVYIGQTGATSRTLNQLPHNHRFLKHASLANTSDHHWQILLLVSPHFTTSTRTVTEPETPMLTRLQTRHPQTTFTQDTDFFYASFSSTTQSLRVH